MVIWCSVVLVITSSGNLQFTSSRILVICSSVDYERKLRHKCISSALLCQIGFVNLLQNPYVCSTPWRGVPDLGVSPNCEMGVCGTNADPAGHLVRLTAGREGSEVAFFGPGGP